MPPPHFRVVSAAGARTPTHTRIAYTRKVHLTQLRARKNCGDLRAHTVAGTADRHGGHRSRRAYSLTGGDVRPCAPSAGAVATLIAGL